MKRPLEGLSAALKAKVKRMRLSIFYSLSDNLRLLLFISLLSSCGKLGSPIEKIVPAEELKTKILENMTDQDIALLDNSFSEYCPSIQSLDNEQKSEALANYYVAISTAEGRRNLYASYYEQSLKSYSVGLFSLSYEDNESYGCHFDKEKDAHLDIDQQTLTNIDKQIECMFLIHRKLLGRPHKVRALVELAQKDSVAKSDPKKLKLRQKLSVYWSVVRPQTDGYIRLKKALKKYMPRACSA